MSSFLDLRCPQCGDQDCIDILAEVWVRVTDDGTDADASRRDEETECFALAATGCASRGAR